MPKIFNQMKPEAHLNKNAFDLSRRDVFSTKAGILTPCLVQHTIPNARYKCSHGSITRTLPIQTPAFARMSENFEYYFVPYSQIWKDFERFYYERGDLQRNITGNNVSSVSSVVPHFSMYELLDGFIVPAYISEQIIYWANEKIATISDAFDRSSSEQNMRRLLDFYRDLDGTYPFLFDVHGNFACENILRNLDLLGYCNLLPEFKLLLNSQVQAIIDTLQSVETDFPNVFLNALLEPDISLTTLKADFIQLRDAFASYILTANEQPFADFISSFDSYLPSVFPIAAYLKVFSDYYRNQQYDLFNYSYLFNYDYVINNGSAKIPASTIIKALLPRFRQWKKDLFTGGYPNAQFGSVAVASSRSTTDIVGAAPITGNVSSDSGKLQIDGSSVDVFNLTSTVSALAIREALSLQRYKERILRAGNRMTSLQTALFGDSSRFIENNYADFIGASKSTIDINSIAATADTEVSNVGELAANGVSVHNDEVFDYHSHDFGIIIGLYYVLPEAEYENTAFDPMNTKSEAFDYYKPDFENLGLQPVYLYDNNILDGIANNMNVNKVLGYLARYWEYKTSLDKVHGEFYGSIPYSPDLLYNYYSIGTFQPTFVPAFLKGAFSAFVTPRPSFTTALQLANLYVNPNCLDNIWYANVDDRQASDCFKVNSYHQISAILPMSVSGLPSL